MRPVLIGSTLLLLLLTQNFHVQIEKALINDCLRISKVSWTFHIPNIYNFAVIYA